VLHTRTLAPRMRAPTLGAPDPGAIWKQGKFPPLLKFIKKSKNVRKIKKLLLKFKRMKLLPFRSWHK
jgi:hypothetical protein